MKIEESFILPPACAWAGAGESLAWSSPASSCRQTDRQTDRQTHTHTDTHSFPYSGWLLLTLGFCWPISLLSGSLDLTSPHLLFLFISGSPSLSPPCVSFSLSVSVCLHFSSLSSASLSSIFPSHLSPRFLLLDRSCPLWSPGLRGRRLGWWGPGCVCRGCTLAPPTTPRTQKGGSLLSGWRGCR